MLLPSVNPVCFTCNVGEVLMGFTLGQWPSHRYTDKELIRPAIRAAT